MVGVRGKRERWRGTYSMRVVVPSRSCLRAFSTARSAMTSKRVVLLCSDSGSGQFSSISDYTQ